MSYMQIRGGTRGGKDQFEWDDVKTDKHRENYLGHSVMAPVGRWQKGKDLSWYSKKSKVLGQKEILKAEIAAVKRAEEEAMAAALGLKPKALASGNVSKQELAEVCRRQSVDEKEEEGQEERMTGLGFMKWSHRHSSQSAATGAAMFESRPVHEVESGPVGRVPPPSLPPPSPATTTATSAAASQHKTQEGLWVDKDKRSTSRHGRGKDKKKKKRKEKSRKKPKKDRSRRNHRSLSSDSEEETSRQRRKRDESSGDYSEEDNDQKRQKKRRIPRSSDSEEERKRDKRRLSEGESGDSDMGEEGRKRRKKDNRRRDRHKFEESDSEEEQRRKRKRVKRQREISKLGVSDLEEEEERMRDKIRRRKSESGSEDKESNKRGRSPRRDKTRTSRRRRHDSSSD